jgi:hypothetical protein
MDVVAVAVTVLCGRDGSPHSSSLLIVLVAVMAHHTPRHR